MVQQRLVYTASYNTDPFNLIEYCNSVLKRSYMTFNETRKFKTAQLEMLQTFYFRSNHSRMLIKTGALKNFANFTNKTPVGVSF